MLIYFLNEQKYATLDIKGFFLVGWFLVSFNDFFNC